MTIDPARYEVHTPGEMSILDELQRAYSELDQLQAEITRLRSLIPAWVTVTEDPETLPTPNRLVIVTFPEPSRLYFGYYDGTLWVDPYDTRHIVSKVRPGDRWCYVPTRDQTTQTQEASHE